MPEESFFVTFTGFVSLEHAKAFAAWYDGQGEQNSDEWLENSDVPPAYVNGRHVIEGNEITIDITPR